MELMVIKNAFVIGTLLYLICDKEKNRVQLSITVTVMYIFANCISIQLQKNFYSIGILLCGLESLFCESSFMCENDRGRREDIH